MRKIISGLTLAFLVTLSGAATAMGNPASINCIKQGGKLQIVGSVGYCQLPNGVKCEEWALFRGECPAKAPTPSKPPIIGGARDAHGCLVAAGYAWCSSTKKCERPWELAKQKRFPNTPAGFNRFCRNPAR
ncbi:MAG: DUF333 domain-containing protein [Thiofilum sp.]|uniref:putative hemolysin n=1 Tax=Thiofilum sp. TaxID=2212733 RepID=UPI0025FDA336|nr:DUF333 domain-containing protein [Thiofilum sp.]MBK8451729.1 DUF333 domain-containing protein [Thiofilum sp.]